MNSTNSLGNTIKPPPPPLHTMSLVAAAFLLLLLATLLISLLSFILRANAMGQKPPLPPGTMGWPYLGETSQLYSNNPNNFFAMKQKRYGSIFKSHILGYPTVMLSSPEAIRFVLLTEANRFRPTFPESKERILGRWAISFQEGEYHVRLRKLVQRVLMPEALSKKVADVEATAVTMLQSCEGGQWINTYKEMKTYSFNVALLYILGKNATSLSYVEELKDCYFTMEKGYNSMPINLPGTLFHKAMSARDRLRGILSTMLSSRRRNIASTLTHSTATTDDLLSSFMDAKEGLSDEQIVDNVVCVIFAARDTTASALTWIIKYLGENPHLLQAITEEQERIARKKRGERVSSLAWEDTRKMPVTTRVIQETLRVSSILPFTFREALEDVSYQGFLIPKGWKVMPLFRNIHHNGDFFPAPDSFDPSRFEVAPKPNTFLPFGSGHHLCPGNELAKLEMLILLHHLSTKYRWYLAESNGGTQFSPFAIPTNGLPIRLFRRDMY